MRKTTFLLSLVLLMISYTSCVSNQKFRQVITQKNTADSTVMYLKTQLEIAEIRAEQQRRSYENDYQLVKEDLKALRQEMNLSNVELQQLIKGKNAILTELKTEATDNYFAAKRYGLLANYDSTQVRTWLKETIYFASGQTQPSLADLKKLDYLIATLETYPNLELQIIGHTDAVPPRYGDNLDVSYRRAKQMLAYFIKKGIDPQRLAIVAQGAFKPLKFDNLQGFDKNRRVEFVLLTMNKPPVQ